VKPILQALLLADKIYQDVTGKKVIAGTFDRLFFTRHIAMQERVVDGEVKKLVVGGMQAGSPSAYISLTEVRGTVHCMLRYVNLEDDKSLLQCEFDIQSDDPIKTVELIIPLPTLPIEKAGVHALELLCDGEPIGSHRIQVEEIEDENPGT
jgi:hypothetical protein